MHSGRFLEDTQTRVKPRRKTKSSSWIASLVKAKVEGRENGWNGERAVN